MNRFHRLRIAARGLLCLVILNIGVNGAWANPPTEHHYPYKGTPHDAFFSIDLNGQEGLVVGAGGRILSTTDGGQSWSDQQSPTPLSLLGVSAAGAHAIAVGQMGVVVRNTAAGWEVLSSGTQERLFDVDVNERGRSVAVGAFGTVLRSPDAGDTWEALKPDWSTWFDDPDGRLGSMFEPSLYGVQVTSQGTIYACGELSLIMRSSNGGRSWEALLAGTNSSEEVSPTLSAIRMTESGLGFAVGQEGTVLRSQDAGQSWQRLDLDTHANLLAVDVDERGQVVVAGMRAVFASSDAGQTWTQLRSDDFDRGWYSEVVLTQAGPLAVGHQGRIVKINTEQRLSTAALGDK